MTDNEIIKALECCANNPNDSVCYESKCPLFGQKCIDVLSKNAIDLINRLNAENENYSHNNRTMAKEIRDLQKVLEMAKAEIEKHEKHIDKLNDQIEHLVFANDDADAEIEKLQKTTEEAVSCFNRMESLYNIKCMELKVAKAEAIKDFAYKLKQIPNSYVWKWEIDYTLKELSQPTHSHA